MSRKKQRRDSPISNSTRTVPRVERKPGQTRRWSLILATVLGVGTLVGCTIAWNWYRVVLVDPPDVPEIKDPEMRALLDRARDQVRTHPASAEAWGRLGKILVIHGGVAQADSCFAQASRLDPPDGRWPYYRALNHLREHPDQVLPYLRQSLAGHLSSQDQVAVRMRLAEVLLEQQEIAEAEQLFQARWQEKPGDPRAAFGLGLITQSRGDSAAAETYLRVASTSPVVQRAAKALLATLARDRGDVQTAAKLEDELSRFPREVPPWPDLLADELARLRVGATRDIHAIAQLESEERYAEAAKIYLKNLERNPTPENTIGAGVNLVRAAKIPAGMQLIQKGIDLDPKRPESYYGLAQAWFHVAGTERERSPYSRVARDQFLEVVKAARQATELKPDYAEAYLLWGGALMGRGDFVDAIVPFQKGVACRPEMAPLQLALGEALLESGRLAEAERNLNNARKLDPKNERVVQTIQRWQLKSK